MAPDLFSVRWTGSVVPKFSETYTFFTVTNDGVRLWVDGQLLIDNWTTHAIAEDHGTLALQAGRPYSLRMEYYENKGTATARLLWSSPSQRKQIIPAESLQPNPPQVLERSQRPGEGPSSSSEPAAPGLTTLPALRA